MARRTLAAGALGALTPLIIAASAFAHAGNPSYESVVRGVAPSIPGFSVQVLNGDDRLEVTNFGTSVVTIDGYNKEPFVRMSPDGTVEVNTKSPALYLDQDRTNGGTVPPFADPAAAPVWKVVERNGRYQFHDHRMHWMGASTPTQVKDTSKRTKIFDWRVPVRTATASGAIDGQLFWRGSSGGVPTAAYVALLLIVVLGAASVVIGGRRRAAADGGDGTGGTGGASSATYKSKAARGEAW